MVRWLLVVCAVLMLVACDDGDDDDSGSESSEAAPATPCLVDKDCYGNGKVTVCIEGTCQQRLCTEGCDLDTRMCQSILSGEKDENGSSVVTDVCAPGGCNSDDACLTGQICFPQVTESQRLCGPANWIGPTFATNCPRPCAHDARCFEADSVPFPKIIVQYLFYTQHHS